MFSQAYLIQVAASAVAIAVMVGLAAWARIARSLEPLDDAKVREVLADEFPYRPIDHVWIADDGAGAVARSGAQALVLYRLGDGYVARELSWTRALSAAPRGGRVTLELSDIAAPRAVLRLSAWPPKELVA